MSPVAPSPLWPLQATGPTSALVSYSSFTSQKGKGDGHEYHVGYET
jgi:hypothetical protein